MFYHVKATLSLFRPLTNGVIMVYKRDIAKQRGW